MKVELWVIRIFIGKYFRIGTLGVNWVHNALIFQKFTTVYANCMLWHKVFYL